MIAGTNGRARNHLLQRVVIELLDQIANTSGSARSSSSSSFSARATSVDALPTASDREITSRSFGALGELLDYLDLLIAGYGHLRDVELELALLVRGRVRIGMQPLVELMRATGTGSVGAGLVWTSVGAETLVDLVEQVAEPVQDAAARFTLSLPPDEPRCPAEEVLPPPPLAFPASGS